MSKSTIESVYALTFKHELVLVKSKHTLMYYRKALLMMLLLFMLLIVLLETGFVINIDHRLTSLNKKIPCKIFLENSIMYPLVEMAYWSNLLGEIIELGLVLLCRVNTTSRTSPATCNHG